ncbi:Fc.00g099880.m01.CDS01 [Cosmosporella sp. VM-42]
MTSWFQNGHSTIFAALSDACRKIDEEIHDDLEVVTFDINSARKERDNALKQVSDLRAENARLKASLQKANAQKPSIPASSSRNDSEDTTGDTGRNLSNSETNWKAECAKVSLKFNALSENFKKAKDALRKRKDERDRWIDHAALLEKKIKVAEEEHGIRILDRNSGSGRATSYLGTTVDAAKVGPNASFASEGGLEQTDLELPPLAAESLHSEEGISPAPTTATNPHSESTQGDYESRQGDLPSLPADLEPDEMHIKEEPSSDAPVVVLERAVKKRKRDEPDTNATPVQRVKVEAIESSSPVLALGQNIFDLQESIDLGDVAQRIMTPRKRKEFEDWQRHDESHTEHPTTVTATTPAPFYVRPDPYPQTAQPLERNSALTPISVNKRIARSGGDKLLAPLKRGLSHGISVLAEDGDVYKRDAGAGQQRGLSGANPVYKGRLDTLLNSPSAPEEGAIIRPISRNRERPSVLGGTRHSSNDLPIPGRRDLPFEKERRPRDKLLAQPESGSSRASGSPGIPPPDTRSPLAYKKVPTSLLRSKPASELRLDDFKINPQANEGHDFAFTEVVRDRAERACLPGCTDMHCCGKQFRALALSQRPNPPLTPAQRREEQKLLEEYLGDYSYRLATMSKEERDGLWVEAKTQELANKYGKHRHRFSRMRSPPGFWNADFPSTQELEAERVEAGKRERQSVQERYREAMRPGGRWVFRDE